MKLLNRVTFISIFISIFFFSLQSCDIVLENGDDDEYYDDNDDYWDDDDDDDFNLFEFIFGDDDDDDDWLDDDDDDFSLFDWLFGDDDEEEDDDYWDDGDDDDTCFSYDTVYGDITMNVTINAENPEVKVEIYRGTIESYSVYKTIYVKSVHHTIKVESGQYAAIAYYKKGKKTIRAIDGNKISESDPGCCDNEANDIELDLTK